MSTILWVVIAVVVVALIVGAVAFAAASRQRSQRLRGRFGSEYDRTLEARGGDRSAAERELSGRMNRRKQLDIVPLSEESRHRYLNEWQAVQTQFVDTPAESVIAADSLVTRVMRERGYPMGDFEQRAADVSVDHPGVVEQYRAAHTISRRTGLGESSTEEQRQALVHYRSLFDELLRAGADEDRDRSRDQREFARAASGSTGYGSAAAPPPPPPPAMGDGRNVAR
jgi:hypothetical protein